MSSSRSTQGGNGIQTPENPKWLNCFLQRLFFDPCQNHDQTKNELNKYCIDCDAYACRYCILEGQHYEHRQLKIYRHVYRDVVVLSDMVKHINCSEIQPYRCNKKLVLAMRPLPHCGSQKIDDAACAICSRILLDPKANSYCSIECKVKGLLAKERDSDPSSVAIKTEKKRKRTRKSTPYRAPFF